MSSPATVSHSSQPRAQSPPRAQTPQSPQRPPIFRAIEDSPLEPMDFKIESDILRQVYSGKIVYIPNLHECQKVIGDRGFLSPHPNPNYNSLNDNFMIYNLPKNIKIKVISE